MRLTIPCIETHTCGEPTRILTIFGIPGDSMEAKREHCSRHLDHIRKALMLEPRGHRHMFGAIVTAPVSKDAVCGAIFMDPGAWLTGCGHATIALGIALVETAMVQAVEPVTKFAIDVPSGRVELAVQVSNGRARETSFRNVAAVSIARDLEFDLPGHGTLHVDVAFGGNVFAILDAAQVGMPLRADTTGVLADLGCQIREAINQQHRIQHPTNPSLTGVQIVTFRAPATNPKARYLNTHVLAAGSVDRSPGGTGTSAVMAALHAKGELQINEEIIAEGIAGGFFKGRLLSKAELNGMPAVIPEITGPAVLTGMHQFFIDPADPLRSDLFLT